MNKKKICSIVTASLLFFGSTKIAMAMHGSGEGYTPESPTALSRVNSTDSMNSTSSVNSWVKVNNSRSSSPLSENSIGSIAANSLSPAKTVQYNAKIDADLTNSGLSLEGLKETYLQQGLQTRDTGSQLAFSQKVDLINQRIENQTNTQTTTSTSLSFPNEQVAEQATPINLNTALQSQEPLVSKNSSQLPATKKTIPSRRNLQTKVQTTLQEATTPEVIGAAAADKIQDSIDHVLNDATLSLQSKIAQLKSLKGMVESTYDPNSPLFPDFDTPITSLEKDGVTLEQLNKDIATLKQNSTTALNNFLTTGSMADFSQYISNSMMTLWKRGAVTAKTINQVFSNLFKVAHVTVPENTINDMALNAASNMPTVKATPEEQADWLTGVSDIISNEETSRPSWMNNYKTLAQID